MLDYDFLKNHLNIHKISLKEYSARFIIGSKTSPRRKIKKEVKEEIREETCEDGFDTCMEIENLFDTL